MKKLTRQGVPDLNHLQPKKDPQRQISDCALGLHRWGDWKNDLMGYFMSRKCWGCKTVDTRERVVW